MPDPRTKHQCYKDDSSYWIDDANYDVCQCVGVDFGPWMCVGLGVQMTIDRDHPEKESCVMTMHD